MMALVSDASEINLKPEPSSLFGVYALLVYFSAQLHELGHWFMATLLGLKFAMGFNRWQILSEATVNQKLAVLAAGPAITLAIIITGFWMFRYMESTLPKTIGLLLVISNSLMIFIPNSISLISGGMGDVGWIAFYLATPQNIIKIILVLTMLATTIAGVIGLEPEMKRVKWLMGLFFTPVAVMGVIVLLDRIAWYSYESGELFLPVWGISALTLLVNGLLAIMGIVMWKDNVEV
jgi:hypothetical protein